MMMRTSKAAMLLVLVLCGNLVPAAIAGSQGLITAILPPDLERSTVCPASRLPLCGLTDEAI